MKIKQKNDGSGEIVFSDEEIKIIKNHKKLILTKEFLKHFMSLFIGLFIAYQKKFDNKTKRIITPLNYDVKTIKPDKKDEV